MGCWVHCMSNGIARKSAQKRVKIAAGVLAGYKLETKLGNRLQAAQPAIGLVCEFSVRFLHAIPIMPQRWL